MELTLFDHFPEPVLYIKSGRIEYGNAAAFALEPDWKMGNPVPEVLALEPDDTGVFSCSLAGRDFQATVTPLADGALLVLRPAVPLPDDAVLEMLPVQLRDLLHNLQAASQMLMPVVEKSGDEESRLHLAVLNQNFYRLLRLARHLEMAGRAEQQKDSEFAEQALDLIGVCREVSYGAAKLAEQAGVRFEMEMPGGVLPCAADRGLLEIMLLELISNAVKAAGTGGEAGIRLAANGSRVLITVWDNGPGMSQADLTAMMDGTSPDSLPKPGTGLRLGLPIARYAAAAHGGAILLESREGCGLKATASLPLKKPAKGKMQTPRAGAEEGLPSLLTMLSDALPWKAFEE